MSLLSEDKSTVAQGNLVVKCQALVTPSVTQHFSLLSGSFKQLVGYLTPREKEYTYVVDTTGAPIELPQGYAPIGIIITPIQNVPDDADFNWWFMDSTDPNTASTQLGANILGTDMNGNAFSEGLSGYARGVDYLGYQWIAFQNNNYPSVLTAGVMKVIVQYI